MATAELNTAQIPVVLCIDVEPDEFFLDIQGENSWEGFEKTHAYFKVLREKLQASTGQAVHFNWFIRMDPQIASSHGCAFWAAETYADFFSDYMAAGDELAAHVHTYRWCQGRQNWIDGCHDQDWVVECLETAVEAHHASFSQPCQSLRFGNFWTSTAAINHAEKIGIKFDLTVEPGFWPTKHSSKGKPPALGKLPHYFHVPREPYYPSRSNFRKCTQTEDRQITMMPLTSAYLKYKKGELGWMRQARSLARNGFQNRLQTTPLSMWRAWKQPNEFTEMIDRAIAAQEKPYLAFAIRTDFPVSPLFSRVDSCLQALLNHPQSSRFVFSTPAAALEIMRQ
jgi:hypothetical protein